MSLKPYFEKLFQHQDLTEVEAAAACEIMLSEAASPVEVGAFLAALTIGTRDMSALLCGMVLALYARSRPIKAPVGAIDVCGTGGASINTFNISTATAIVVAGCGVPVAKHGNMHSSSLCGSPEVLAELGVNMNVPVAVVQRCLDQAGCCFMLTPRHHEAMRNVAQVRQEIGVQTVFDVLIPLVNPAGVKRHLLGVSNPAYLEPVAQALRRLRVEKAWIVHGDDGLDEITTTGTTKVVELKSGKLNHFEIAPEQAGLPRACLSDLEGGSAQMNGAALRSLLDGHRGPYRDIVLLNAAAALIVADKVSDLKAGIELAAKAIDDGRAAGVLALVATICERAAA